MRTFMLVSKDERGNFLEIAGPCVEKDIVFDDSLEVIDECIFKTLHPKEYNEALIADLPFAVHTWMETLYGLEEPIERKEQGIYMQHCILQVTPSEVHVMLYTNAAPAQAAKLVLHLRECLPVDVAITITQIPNTVTEPILN